MQAAAVLSSAALILLAGVVWDDMRRNDRMTSARRTWLVIACVFAVVSAILRLLA